MHIEFSHKQSKKFNNLGLRATYGISICKIKDSLKIYLYLLQIPRFLVVLIDLEINSRFLIVGLRNSAYFNCRWLR